MANNHMGSVDHAKKIIDQFSILSKKWNINSAVKLQFRQLDTFIHPFFKKRNDIKNIKRFNDTKLNKNQFGHIVSHIHKRKMLSMATPFDERSIPLIDKFGIDMIKIASCSIDDWPLLERICKIKNNKKIIISTADADFYLLCQIYDMFKKNNKDFAFMHCVAEYPTPFNVANLSRIDQIKKEFPDIQVGFSTHESPMQKSLVPFAVSMGCTIIEKHIGASTDKYELNDYTVNVDQMNNLLKEIDIASKALIGVSKKQKQPLRDLKRGIYFKKDMRKDQKINKKDIYFSMPVQESMLDASFYNQIVDSKLMKNKKKNSGLYPQDLNSFKIIEEVKIKVNKILKEASIMICEKDLVEMSCHHGLESFLEVGCVIISKKNHSCLKKILVFLSGQSHPTHKHSQKQESVELLIGDCELILNKNKINLNIADPVFIDSCVDHSFSSKKGCVLEEISKTNTTGDSIYQNKKINKLIMSHRKIRITL